MESKVIKIKMLDKLIEVDLTESSITKSSIKAAFLLDDDAVVSLYYEVDNHRKWCKMNEAGTCFLLPNYWFDIRFFVESDKIPSRPVTPINSPYSEAASPPPPLSKFIDKWMFFAIDSAGKSTVVCVHPRHFVTFRHGTHLQLKVGDIIRIFHAKIGINEHVGYDVRVVEINEKLDFILLQSKEIVVSESPRLVAAEESEAFLLAGFGDQSTGQQELAYLSGIVHSVRGYYFFNIDKPGLVMGPFVLGTSHCTRGDSAGACWSSKGLIGINFGVTNMPETTHSFAISEAATFSPKNIISPATYIKDSLMAQLGVEKQVSPKPPLEKKRKPHRVEIEGIGSGNLTTDFDEA